MKPRSKHAHSLEITSLSGVYRHSMWTQGQLTKSKLAKRQLAKQTTHQIYQLKTIEEQKRCFLLHLQS